MFTVKLFGKRDVHTMQFIEATQVNIHYLRPDELIEIAGKGTSGEIFSYYVAPNNKPRPEGFADEVEFWWEAYIENSTGKTTHTIRF